MELGNSLPVALKNGKLKLNILYNCQCNDGNKSIYIKVYIKYI
jgi:hypothetical protein